jgi:apolipoprotein N-acyltransferase
MALSSARTLWRWLLAFLCGTVVPLGFAPFGWYPVPVLALALLAGLLYGTAPRQAFTLGWLFGLGEFGVGVSWVHISIHEYGNAGLALSIATMLLLVAYLALFPALMGWVLSRTAGASRPRFLLATFPAAWALSEWLRSWLFTGFPWLNLGYSQIDAPLVGFAPLLGVYGVGFLTALSGGLVTLLVTTPGRSRLVAGTLVVLLWLAGWQLNQYHWTRPAGKALTATLVQGNIPQALKWQPDQQQATLDRYVELTSEHLGSDLVVWPETAVPAFYDQVEADFLVPLRERMRASGVSLVTGIPVLDRSDWDYYNAVISLDEPGAFYYKVHLVPFGEYLPLRDWLAGALSFLPVPESDFTAGRIDQPLLQAAGHAVGTSICYEIAFGEQLIHTLPQAAFLINVSNDAWFGASLAPYQHEEMARMRARETERYILRATNTGISAIIDADGSILAQSHQFKTETITHSVQPRAGATPYVRWGNWPVVALSVILLLLAGRRHGRVRRVNKSPSRYRQR